MVLRTTVGERVVVLEAFGFVFSVSSFVSEYGDEGFFLSARILRRILCWFVSGVDLFLYCSSVFSYSRTILTTCLVSFPGLQGIGRSCFQKEAKTLAPFEEYLSSYSV